MKFIVTLLCVSISLFAFSQKVKIQQSTEVKETKVEEAKVKKNVELTFNHRHVSMGEVTRGEIKETSFQFTNTGLDSIEIELVSSCDCTTIEYTRGSIAPGETGLLEVVFDSTEKEESETVDIDIILKNEDPKTGSQIFEILTYDFILLDK